MRFSTIGVGRVALTIARSLLAHGHEIALSSRRGAAALTETAAALGPGATAVSVSEAASAEIVLLAVPWLEVERALSDLPPWNGRILVDTTNPFIKTPLGRAMADLGGRSASTIVASYAPGARVVKAFNSITMVNYDKGPTQDGGRRVLFISGDDAPAKGELRAMIESFGYAVLDLGGLEDGGRMQQGGGPIAGRDLVMFADWKLN